jgi:putative heme-binding domain-containing protein
MKGFEKAYEGRRLSDLPAQLVSALAKAGGGSEVLKVRQRKSDAIVKALAVLGDEKADVNLRSQFVDAFRDLKYEPAIPVLLKVATSSNNQPLQSAALAAMQTFSGTEVGNSVLDAYSMMPADVRQVAQTLLSSRSSWAKQFLSAVEANRIPRDQVTQDTVWRLQSIQDEQLSKQVKKIWGDVRGATSAELKQLVAEYEVAIKEDRGDPYAGKKLFTATCAKCHKLFDSGGNIGPELTSYKRDDLTRMLLNVADPSAEIREGYETWLAITEDGRTVTGFKIDEDDEIVALRGADGVRVSLPKDELEELVRQPVSIMPTGLLDKMNDQQKRDLFAYLRSSQPLNNKP